MSANTYPSLQNQGWFDARPTLPHRMALRAVGQAATMARSLPVRRRDEGFGILMYHRVADRIPGVARPTYNVTPGKFRRQLSGLLAQGFECWPLSKLLEAHGRAQAVPLNSFAITFDDGYENHYSHAWPILRELNLPATIFLATKYLDTDQPFPFDDWSAKGSARVPATSWKPLTTAQCTEMLCGGLIDFGAHTHRHKRFRGHCDQFREDLQVCLGVLRDRLGIDHPPFTFPYGDRDEELTSAARQLGVSCCLSTAERRVRPGDDVHRWGRFDVGERDTPGMLAAKLSGQYEQVIAAGHSLAAIGSQLADRVLRPFRIGSFAAAPAGHPGARTERARS